MSPKERVPQQGKEPQPPRGAQLQKEEEEEQPQ
jgi:hypothetical protein